MSHPIIFLYAAPLDRTRRELALSRNTAYPSVEEVKQTIEAWKKIWEEVNAGDRVLKRFEELTGAVLPYPTEVNVIGGMFNAMSRPFILVTHPVEGRALSRDEFLSNCIHELAHRFISVEEDTDPRKEKYWGALREKYPNEVPLTRSHILIYALLSIVVPECAGASAWEACKNIENNPPYQRALDIMNERGAMECIEDFRGR
jgi:hypothetical protein